MRVESPKQLAISSIQQQLRRARAEKNSDNDTEIVGGGVTDTASGLGEGASGTWTGGNSGGEHAGAGSTGSGGAADPTSYSWYRVEITNRSITDEAKREAVRAHLLWLAATLDDDALDHQLVTLKYDLMAATSADLAADIKARAQTIQANKAVVEEEL